MDLFAVVVTVAFVGVVGVAGYLLIRRKPWATYTPEPPNMEQMLFSERAIFPVRYRYQGRIVGESKAHLAIVPTADGLTLRAEILPIPYEITVDAVEFGMQGITNAPVPVGPATVPPHMLVTVEHPRLRLEFDLQLEMVSPTTMH